MQHELISIIVPIFNVQEYLIRCLESLNSQTYEELEILLIDDKSTDGSAAIAQAYASKHSEKFRFISRETNGGLSAARNTGINQAKGTWIAFCDSDDWVGKDYISSMWECVDDDTDMVVNTMRVFVYENDHITIHDLASHIGTHSSYKEKIAFLPYSAWMKLFRKKLFDTILFPEDIRRCEDLGTIVPIMTRGKNIAVLHEPNYFYFQRKDSLSRSNQKGIDVSFYPQTINRMMQLSLKSNNDELEFRAISEYLYGMVMLMIRSGKTKKEIINQIELVNRNYPGWQKNKYIRYLPKGKRIFIYFAKKKKYIILKILICIRGVKQRWV